jgi:plastocyanin
MSDKSKHPIGRVVHLNTVEADTSPDLVELEPGGTLEWKNHSTHCPHFEILFEDPSPVESTEKLTGTLEKSVSIRMPEKEGKFLYKVRFKRKDGTHCKDGPQLSIRTCPGGGPC